ncbi:DUF4197 domain-containing protein [Nafulsella turpanensis]|uniref:DUF4197 domain-containing protein n=1 Tax=Nafulsella turpanensis TaxID=1265690 RepID=UPI00035D3E93|nr:DUF4197 domain-containing protein [Nafulsella turpanensis]
MRYINRIGLLVFLFFAVSCTTQQINQTLGEILAENQSLTTEEVAEGLKQALSKGISQGAAQASQEGGYYENPRLKIPFPEDAQRVEEKLRQIGLGNQVDRFILTLNRGAEEAAKEAKPIFLDAIRSMTIRDAWNILKGEDDAATEYLRRTTGEQLRAKFEPVISRALDQVEATRYYGDIVSTYNRLPGVTRVNPDLTDYATQKAIDGLFLLVAEEEKNIRENPVARTTELLKKVFAQAD